jgi:hypothetical protein
VTDFLPLRVTAEQIHSRDIRVVGIHETLSKGLHERARLLFSAGENLTHPALVG